MPVIIDTRTVHEGWGRFLIARIRLPSGEEISREIEDHGSAVAVLPYCPETRTALLVGQLRAPLLMADGRSEFLEVPAGRVESADPDGDARRELEEEVGLSVHTLDLVADTWSMPGVSTERIRLYLAAFAPADRIGAGGGLAHEGEEIRVVEEGLDELWAMMERGALADMKSVLLLHALRLRRPELFGAVGREPSGER